MPTMYDADDIVDMKNRKKRLKRLRKLLIFLLIAAIGAALYITRDKWYNKLRGIGKGLLLTAVSSPRETFLSTSTAVRIIRSIFRRIRWSFSAIHTLIITTPTARFSKSVSTPIQIPLCAQRGTAFSFMRTAERI